MSRRGWLLKLADKLRMFDCFRRFLVWLKEVGLCQTMSKRLSRTIDRQDHERYFSSDVCPLLFAKK